MKNLVLLVAILTTAPAIAQAATVQAIFTATVDYFYDGALTFGGQTAEVGDEISISFLYNPDLAKEGWIHEDPSYVTAYGGSTYDNNGYDYPVTSPVLSATINFGSASYTLDGGYYGFVHLNGWQQVDGIYSTNISFNASSAFDKQIYLDQSFLSSQPSPLLNPTFEGPFTIDFPKNDYADGSFLLADNGNLLTQVQFSLTHAEIAPYNDTPQPAPVPLPAGAPLILTGLAALIGLGRLKRRA